MMKKLITRILRAIQWRTAVFSENLAEVLESRVSVEDISNIRKSNPLLIDAVRIKKCYDELSDLHLDYCTRYSDKVHVVSLEQAAFLLNACRLLTPNRVVDLGSGFSSYVVRKYAKESRNADVCTVDDNASWLNKTAEFLKERDLPVNGLILASDFFKNAGSSSFDFVFYDLGNMQIRREYFEETLKLFDTKNRSIMLIDDVHKSDYRSFVVNTLRERKINFLNLKKVTLDDYGRYSFAIIPE